MNILLRTSPPSIHSFIHSFVSLVMSFNCESNCHSDSQPHHQFNCQSDVSSTVSLTLSLAIYQTIRQTFNPNWSQVHKRRPSSHTTGNTPKDRYFACVLLFQVTPHRNITTTVLYRWVWCLCLRRG